MFRRMFWSGSNAKFTAFHWRGDEKQTSIGTRNYHCNVENAFGTAKSFSQFVSLLDGEKTVAAHSLGNMLVLSSIHNWNAPIKNYLMLDAAVPMEAIEGTSPNNTVPRANLLTGETAPINEDMVHIAWEKAPDDRYKPHLWASEWHCLWTGGDGRSKLTWRNRLSNLRNVNVYNFYSSGEEVLDHHDHTEKPSRDDTIFGHPLGRYAWAIQEKLKGCMRLNGTGGSNFGGWGFGDVTNTGRPIIPGVAANTLTAAELRQQPFFNRKFDSRQSGS